MTTRLTEPLTLAGRRSPSRVLFGPHETNLADGRALSGAHTAYYERRAAGGAGVIVTETASVHDSDWPYERAPLAAECGPGWAAVVDACRPHGALVVAALGHAGSQGSSAFSQTPLWAPSRVPDVASRELPMEMEPREIAAVTEGFAAATALAMESDVDGVEVDAGQHALLRQFLSGLTNQRGDAYGEDKSLLLREVLAAVRAQLGADRILGLRLSCDELAPWAGITPDHAREIVGDIASEVDYLVVVRGSAMGTSATKPDAHTEPGFNLDLARGIREAVDGKTPVVLQGSVVDTEQAEHALTDGAADLVEMTRAQLADPDLVVKLRSGQAIRPCTLTNQKCRARDNRNPVVSCIGEPRTGHEVTDPPADGTDTPRSVFVIGGGPAGLEAARVLALRGHQVRLVERENELGGTLALAARLPGHERLARLVDWLAGEVTRLGVDIATGTEATEADLAEAGSLVLATGSAPGPRPYRSEGRVVDVVGLLRDGADAVLTDGPVAVFDPIGDATGVAVAELLAATGRATTIITQDQVVGTQLALTGDLADANARLQRAGVTLRKASVLREVRSGSVLVTDVFTGAESEFDCANVVHCGHRVPERTELPAGAVAAGDLVAPRTVHEAVLEGRRAAMAFARQPAQVA